ncbi:MAG: DUF3883 domain-containing protein [Verrucomicrobia bacterium]|nr:DUF3883 domain-containing protein [Cytophagales bacterium]
MKITAGFYGGQANTDFLRESHVFYTREIEAKASLFVEKQATTLRVYLLDFNVGLFLLNEKEMKILLGGKRISARSLDMLDWKQLQFLKRTSQIVLVNYFQRFNELTDNFPEFTDYEALVMKAEDFRQQMPVPTLTAKYFWYFVQTALLNGQQLQYSEKGAGFTFNKDSKITPGRARKHLKILQEKNLLNFQESPEKIFHVRFNKLALHIHFHLAPHFFKHLVFDDILFELTQNQLAEPEIPYQPKPKKLQEKGQKIIAKKRKKSSRLLTDEYFLNLYQKQVAMGKISEEKVLALEIKQLQENGKSELATKVRSVANDPSFGFDVISYENDGTEKQIEVKSIQTQGNQQSFIITRNELEKSQSLPNYYIYCVENPLGETSKISFFRKPDLQNRRFFQLEALNFQVIFDVE